MTISLLLVSYRLAHPAPPSYIVSVSEVRCTLLTGFECLLSLEYLMGEPPCLLVSRCKVLPLGQLPATLSHSVDSFFFWFLCIQLWFNSGKQSSATLFGDCFPLMACRSQKCPISREFKLNHSLELMVCPPQAHSQVASDSFSTLMEDIIFLLFFSACRTLEDESWKLWVL